MQGEDRTFPCTADIGRMHAAEIGSNRSVRTRLRVRMQAGAIRPGPYTLQKAIWSNRLSGWKSPVVSSTCTFKVTM